MGLAADLDYSVGARNGVQRALAALGSTRPVSRASNRLIRPLDRMVSRLTDNRSSATGWLIGARPLWLTTTGARTGEARTVPLFGIPIEEDLALLGTSFGQSATPAWVHNLEADPRALVSYRGVEVAARARPAGTAEADVVWRNAASIYRGYANYADWAAHRVIRVFVLESDRPGSAGWQVGSS